MHVYRLRMGWRVIPNNPGFTGLLAILKPVGSFAPQTGNRARIKHPMAILIDVTLNVPSRVNITFPVYFPLCPFLYIRPEIFQKTTKLVCEIIKTYFCCLCFDINMAHPKCTFCSGLWCFCQQQPIKMQI